MKRIDFHIHTKTGLLPNGDTDHAIDFSIESLEAAVSNGHLDAIAITNHNVFDKAQYELIRDSIGCVVFPGIEVSVEKTHILAVFSEDSIIQLEALADSIGKRIIAEGSSFSASEFVDVLGATDHCLIIPHYRKRPQISDATLSTLRQVFDALEVKSQSYWSRAIKDTHESLPPLLFSDFRAEQDEDYPESRATYINCDDLRVEAMKTALTTKSNVSLVDDTESRFAHIADGIVASTRLNVILGTRSSGKTYLLNTIEKAFGKNNVKYVKQFDLAKDAGEPEVLKAFADSNSQFVEAHRKQIKELTDLFLSNTQRDSQDTTDDYIKRLQEWANAQKDTFSLCKIYSSTQLREAPIEDEKKVFNAVVVLLSSAIYVTEIATAIDRGKLLELLAVIVEDLKKKALHNELTRRVNATISTIQKALASKSETPAFPSGYDIVDGAKRHIFEERYYKLVEHSWKAVQVNEKPLGRYYVRFTQKKYTSATRIKEVLSNNPSLSQVCRKSTAKEYIADCRAAGVSDSELYRALFDIELSAIDELGNNLSGGQWSELLLLARLQEAINKDALLLDEPEGSFDNPFLNEHIIAELDSISEKNTVFIVTHNNNLGASIRPDVFFLTDKNGASFDVLTARLGDAEFVSQTSGQRKSTYTVLMDNLEAGEVAYTARRELYEGSRN